MSMVVRLPPLLSDLGSGVQFLIGTLLHCLLLTTLGPWVPESKVQAFPVCVELL